jgi:ABC-type transport system involved in multi-copper enzyme maturation permease subunit
VDGDTAAVTGSGDIAYQLWGDDDVVLNSLSGVLAFLLVVIVVSVLFITSEFRRGLIRTTFTASPRRGRVILAKALVIAPVTFIAGLVAAAGSYVFSRPQLAENGFAAPSYPVRPITDPTVLRAVVGAALMLALVAVLGVSLGAILRRGAAAIALLMAALVAPQILLGALPLDVALWIGRATPTAGFAVMQTRERWDTAISPWAGLGVLAGYALVALVIAIGRLRWRDA